MNASFGIQDKVRRRAYSLGAVALLLLVVLASRLWFLQVLSGERYANAAQANAVRIVQLDAPRGRILDRNGVVLVGNRPSLAVGIARKYLKNANRVLPQLSKMLGVPLTEIRRRLADKRVSPYKPVIVAEDVAPEVIFALNERSDEFPGVQTQILPVRLYPYGMLGAHEFGYVGETTESELKKLTAKGYRLGDQIGRAGLESAYESVLRGQPGFEKLEVNATGTVLRSLGKLDPKQGDDLQLALDLKVQQIAEESLVKGIERARSQTFRQTGDRFKAPAGAVVALDVQTGGVVAMASFPTFDPAKFVGGVSADYWSFLNDPENANPLLNRATQAAYPPGSTFKPFVALGALDTGAASARGGYECTSSFKLGNVVFRNWESADETMSLSRALERSCDTVFYRFGASFWRSEQSAVSTGRPLHETMTDWANRFGMGALTNIDLPAETKGQIPSRAWKRALWERNKKGWCALADKTKDPGYQDLCERGYVWRGGDAVNMSIGQGDVQVTPLGLATAYAALANGGRVLQPHVADKVLSPEGETIRAIGPKVLSTVKVSGADLRYVQQSLVRVAEEGTAVFPFRNWPYDTIKVAAKTGSAEIAGKQPFSWFAAFAPADKPRYVVVSVVEQAGFGSQVAGPVVRRVMDQLFGLPLTPIVFGARSD